MEATDAVSCFAALGHETRLGIFRLLIEAGKAGLSAGEISSALSLPAATASFHLNHLSRTGLIHGERDGRFINYSADFAAMDQLITFLTENCCQGEACLSTPSSPCNTSHGQNT